MRPVTGETPRDGIMRRLFGQRGSVEIARRQASVVAVTSGKGGTGKSFVASNLAVAFAHAGHRTTLVDCDFGLGNAHLLLGVNPKLTLQHVLTMQAHVAEVRCRTAYGPELVPAGSGISRLSELSERELLLLAQCFDWLAARDDVLLLDTAAGISPQCLLTLLLADHVVLVTNPEIAALTDAYALVKCLARQPAAPQVWVVVNRAPAAGLGQATFEKLRSVAQRFAGYGLRYLGEVLEDPAVTQRRLGQPPLLESMPDGDTAARLRGLMTMLRDQAGGMRRRPVPREEMLVRRLHRHMSTRATD